MNDALKLMARYTTLSAMAIVVAGCSGGDELKPTLPQVTPVAAAPVAVELTPAVAGQANESAVVAQEFKPPFANREELFLPPAKEAVRAERQDGGDVALRGFLNVDGLKVLLAVNGRTQPVAAGEELGGIEVIAIEPPGVTLQRGRVRWVESLVETQ